MPLCRPVLEALRLHGPCSEDARLRVCSGPADRWSSNEKTAAHQHLMAPPPEWQGN